MSSGPRFSIVIPTRNRAELVRFALQSALDQSCDDYEIVVSNNASDDNTEAVVRDIGSHRIRYVRTDQVLSMPDHWQFALGYARGSFVTYLCDDDALTPSLLSTVTAVDPSMDYDLIAWSMPLYHHSSWTQSENVNRLLIGSVTNHVERQFCRDNLRALFRTSGWAANYPRMLNSFVSRRLLDRIQQGLGRVFLPLAPDYTFCAAALATCDTMLWIAQPLAVAGYSDKSIGAAQIYTRGQAHQAFTREFDDFNFAHTPLHTPTLTNITTDAIMKVKMAMGDLFQDIEVDWGTYFARCQMDLELLAANGVAVTDDFAELEKQLAVQPAAVRQRAAEVVAAANVEPTPSSIDNRSWVRRTIRGTLDRSRTLLRLELGIRGSRSLSLPPVIPHSVNGHDAGFSNILECAQWLDRAIASANLRSMSRIVDATHQKL